MRIRRSLAATAVAAVVVVLVPGSPAAAATTPTVRLASGVTLTRSSFAMRSGSGTVPETVISLSVTLSAHTSLVAATPDNVIGAPRATVLAMARQQHAIAGINGDFFYFSDPTAVPRGGLIDNGRTLKSPLVGKLAALYVTPSGRATIGDPGFAGLVVAGPRASYKIRSLNSLENAKNGALTIVDHNVLAAALPGCALARLTATATAGSYVVSSYAKDATRFTRLAGSARALVTCSAAGRTWLGEHAAPGTRLSITTGYAVGRITTLVSGGRVLIRAGKRYDDKDGLLGYGNQRKPETFGCILRSGTQLLLGAVEGDRPGLAGMTYAELTTYLLAKKCWSAITYDGSGSSTVVAKRPGHTLAVQNITTNKGGPRRVVDGLFVVEH